jgi:hypothetical protein
MSEAKIKRSNGKINTVEVEDVEREYQSNEDEEQGSEPDIEYEENEMKVTSIMEMSRMKMWKC